MSRMYCGNPNLIANVFTRAMKDSPKQWCWWCSGRMSRLTVEARFHMGSLDKALKSHLPQSYSVSNCCTMKMNKQNMHGDESVVTTSMLPHPIYITKHGIQLKTLQTLSISTLTLSYTEVNFAGERHALISNCAAEIHHHCNEEV